MSALDFIRRELTEAIGRGVKQCVVIGSRPVLETSGVSPAADWQVFGVGELAANTLACELEHSEFDKRKSSVFVWLGAAGYRTVEAMISSLSFIASLPKGSVLVFDYVEARTSLVSLTHTALDALATRLQTKGGSVLYLIQPQAVNALLRGVGFREIVDLAPEESTVSSGRLVSALV